MLSLLYGVAAVSSLPHQKLREIVFLCLFSKDLGGEDTTKLLMETLNVARRHIAMGEEKAAKVREKRDELDQLIAETSTSYAFERIQWIERNILRLGLFEILYDQDVPPKVAIAEALRLCRKFGTSASTAFVNAVLDALYKRNTGEKVDLRPVGQASDALAASETLIEKIAPTLHETSGEPASQ